MKIEPKFNIRDPVYCIMCKTEKIFEPCVLCESIGSLFSISKENKIICPNCNGYKEIEVGVKVHYYVDPFQHEICDIKTTTNDKNGTIIYYGTRIRCTKVEDEQDSLEHWLYSNENTARKECLKLNQGEHKSRGEDES